MKVPLRYQMSEYDCGPTSLLNAVSYLFEEEEISPDLIRGVMLYCLDGFGSDGVIGKTGTTATAMMFLSNWLTNYGKTGRLPIACRYFAGDAVHFHDDSPILTALRSGAVAVQRLYLDVGHYVLLTGVEGERVRLFDPYYEETTYDDPDIQVIHDQPFACNRIVPIPVLEQEGEADYNLGPVPLRETVLLFHEGKA